MRKLDLNHNCLPAALCPSTCLPLRQLEKQERVEINKRARLVNCSLYCMKRAREKSNCANERSDANNSVPTLCNKCNSTYKSQTHMSKQVNLTYLKASHSTGIIYNASKISHETFHRQKSPKKLPSKIVFRNHNSILFSLKQSLTLLLVVVSSIAIHENYASLSQAFDSTSESSLPNTNPSPSNNAESNSRQSPASSCFGGLQTFEKISMSTFENPSSSGNSFGSGILVQQDDQALTSECVNLCRSQANCLSFVIDYNKFECKSYATTQQELQQEFDERYQAARSLNNSTLSNTTIDPSAYHASASTGHFQHLLPSASSNYFEKICLDGVANRNQFDDVCGQGRLWAIERVVDSFLDGYVEKEVTNVNNKDECSKLCIFETQFVCRSADYDPYSRLCRLSKEDRRTQPQAMRYVLGSNRQYLEKQCATPGPSSCVYETKKNVSIISMDALKFAQTVQDCQMKCNQESTFNCRSYSFYQQRCFLSGDDSSSLNSNLIKFPVKQGWHYGAKKCLVEICTKGIFSYEKITGYTLRSALSTPIDLMMPSASSLSTTVIGNNLDEVEKLQNESSQTRMRHLVPLYNQRTLNNTSNLVSLMMMSATNAGSSLGLIEPLQESESLTRNQRSASNLAITNHCRHSCDLGYLNCPAFTIDYKNNRCQRLDRNSQGRHHELVARDGFAYYEKICLRVPEIMSMCQDKYWIFERVIGYELAPRLYEKSLKFVQSRRDCEEYCLEEKQFQCRSALYNDEVSDCKLSRYDRRLATQEGGYYRNFNARISYLENQCIRDHVLDNRQHCYYEQAKEEAAYPTFTEHIEMVQPPSNPMSTHTELETEFNRQQGTNNTATFRYGRSYCEQLCNDNSKFECHSFGYYASTAQCFLSGDDSISAGESTSTSSTGFTYYEKKCRLAQNPENTNHSSSNDPKTGGDTTGNMLTPLTPTEPHEINPYIQPDRNSINYHMGPNISSPLDYNSGLKPMVSNNNISIHIDQQLNMIRPTGQKPLTFNGTGIDSNQYKCGQGHTFVYQRISGFEPIGGYLTLLIKSNDKPGLVSECADLCRRAYECRAFVVDYNNNQCFAMLENSSVGVLSLRQTIGKDYFEGFCIADHILLSGSSCRNKIWIIDKIVDQAVIGVQHQKLIADTDRLQCRQACLEERLFWCKSAMFDSSTGDCKLYPIDRESIPQMRLLFTKGVDFFENQCQIVSNSCPYDAIERDMTIVTITKSIQARSTFDCEHACNNEVTFNCRSYTYQEQYPGLPNMCLLSSDSRSTSQQGSVKEHQRTLYAERNCYFRRPRYPGGSNFRPEPINPQDLSPNQMTPDDPSQNQDGLRQHMSHSTTMDPYATNRPSDIGSGSIIGSAHINSNTDIGTTLGQGCDPHQYTFERTFGYDFKLAQKERAPIAPSVGISIACQQECLRRGDRCQSFVVEYALPFQSCFLIETQVGANKKLLIKSANSAYFEKICLPRVGIESESIAHAQSFNNNNNNNQMQDLQSMDIAPSYSHEPWSPQAPNQLPYYLQQQQLVQNYPSRSCAKLWAFERFVNHNFTAPSDKTLDNILNKAQCETLCLNEAAFSCRAATYDYANKICKLFKNTRRTIMSQFVDLELPTSSVTLSPVTANVLPNNSQPGTVHVISGEIETLQGAHSSVTSNSLVDPNRRQANSRQLAHSTGEPINLARNVDYLENTCSPEPSSCQYRQLYDLLNPYVDRINHAVSLSDCQRQCDLERLFSCKSINYEPSSKTCMLINEDLISLNRGQQASLIPKKNTIYSEKGNCEMISVQCNSQEMLVSINFDAPFRGRIMAKGNPEQCFLVGDGQTSLRFPIVFGPKCNSRQEGHNTFVNEVVIQQHPIIMTESDKIVRIMCAFEAPDQTITLKNPTSRDNKTGIDVSTPESSRTRHDKQTFNSVVSNKAAPPSVVLRILDQNGRDASMINLGDELILRIQMQTESQNSALGIFARNLAARSSNGETLLLIDNEGCPIDSQVFPALEVDPKDGKSLYSTFKAFRFPSSGLVNFEVQIRFCPERCQPVDCHRGQKMRSYGRKKRQTLENQQPDRISVIESVTTNHQDKKSPIEALSTVMKPGKAFQYVRELLLAPQVTTKTPSDDVSIPNQGDEISIDMNKNRQETNEQAPNVGDGMENNRTSDKFYDSEEQSSAPDHSNNSNQPSSEQANNEFLLNDNGPPSSITASTNDQSKLVDNERENFPPTLQKSILMHVDEKVVPSTGYMHTRSLNQPHSLAPYGRLPLADMQIQQTLDISPTVSNVQGQSPVDNIQAYSTTSAPVVEHKSINSTDESTKQNQNLGISNQVTTELSDSLSSMSKPLTDDYVTSKTNDISPPKTDILSLNNQRTNPKDLPLRFSILVGDNQIGNTGGWTPGGSPPVLVMNSTNVDLDHIVIPGKEGQSDSSGNSNKNLNSNRNATPTQTPSDLYIETVQPNYGDTRSSLDELATKTNTVYDQNFDALSSNSVTAEVKLNYPTNHHEVGINNDKKRLNNHELSRSQSETAASHDCQIESGNNRLWTIIWTGSVVIVLNICLVLLSLVLYFKKIHLRQHHDIMRTSSEYGTDNSNNRFRWPSVLLKSKNNLGTSLNTHEHFFCKLNSKPNASDGHDFNWPNLSASSSHSTISSMASQLPITNIRINQTRPLKLPFEAQTPSRNNFIANHKSILENGPYGSGANTNLHEGYTNNVCMNEKHSSSIESVR